MNEHTALALSALFFMVFSFFTFLIHLKCVSFLDSNDLAI